MDVIKLVNAVISFTAEIAMLVFLAIGGYNILDISQIGRWIIAILLPSIAIMLWAQYIAPKSAHQLNQPWLCVAQIVLYASAAAVASGFTSHGSIIIFLVFGFGSSVLAVFTKQ